ncbi:MAG: alkaline phosphatase family protein [Bacteroidetes bacterium]|nr:alkaline phosphatase family protein [Bacteroidota bacterium]MBU1761200.1 alkaline phosphatase family protein [Bacteroidota bacterium]
MIIVTIDGLRWQELFRGADSSLTQSRYNSDKIGIAESYWTKNVLERRKLLMPFFWGEIEKKGQIFGNRDLNSKMEVANPYRVSRPGYHEMFNGFVDTAVKNNDRIYIHYPNIFDVAEEIFRNKNLVASFSSWDVFNFILNDDLAKYVVNAGIEDLNIVGMPNTFQVLNEMQRQAPPFISKNVRLDVITYQLAKQFLKTYQPKLLHIGFDETDDMAHAEDYKFYIEQAHQSDKMIANLWKEIQSNPFYKNQTTLIITTDHGRGEVPYGNWTSHGQGIPGSEQTWLAVIGPNISAKGEIKNGVAIYNQQIAATIAHILGINYKNSKQQIAKPIDLN